MIPDMNPIGDNKENIINVKKSQLNLHFNDNDAINVDEEIIDSEDGITKGQQPGEFEEVEEIEEEEDEEEEEDDDEVEKFEDGGSQDDDLTVTNDKFSLPSATHFNELATKLMKPVPDYPVKEQNHNVWHIKSWSKLTEPRIRGPTFVVGGYEWNILLFPNGNGNNYLSIYIEPRPIKTSDETISDDWYVCAQFAFDLWNVNHPNSHLPSASYHRFSKSDTDWGFSSFIDLKQLSQNKLNGHTLLENDQLNITAFVKVIDDSSTGVLWHNFVDYDSKKSTGYVGLNNQGATCYLNSLLQSYYTTKIFRKLVYQIPTTSNVQTKSNNKKIRQQSSVALSLQKIFYLLSSSDSPVGTLDLTKAFGWDSSDAFTQHDIQELNRILMDKLEASMKDTPIENRLNDLFVGKMKSFIKCIDVPYESARTEDFWDIQLNVKGFNNLKDSFKNYIELEMLTDDNKYQADKYGYQDAKKGVIFESFPPILHLQLKRFEYDFMIDDLQKINDFYQFPDQIDLKEFLDEDLPLEIKNQNWNYKLHGVLVHQGSISNGHYYAMLKPNFTDSTWFRFEDDKVWKATPSQVFVENFGANELSQEEFLQLSRIEQNENLIRRSTSAYMLVYYRESELSNILPPNDEEIDKHVPSFIPIEIENQLNEIQLLEQLKQQQLYNINVKLVNSNNFRNYSEFDLYYDSTNLRYFDQRFLQDSSVSPYELSLKKTDSVFELYTQINNYLSIDKPVNSLEDLSKLPYRLLVICHRNNHTNRIDGDLSLTEEDDLKLISLYNKFFNKKYDEMVFFIEQFNYELNNINENNKYEPTSIENLSFDKVFDKFKTVSKINNHKSLNENIIIFLKFFDPISNQVRGLTHIIVTKDSPVSSIIEPVNEFLNYALSTPLAIFEELTPNKLEPVNESNSFERNELNNGDILCLQPKNVENYTEHKKFKDVHDYFRFLATRMHIKVYPRSDRADDESENGNYDSQEEDNYPEAENSTNGLDLWISSLYSYQQLSDEIAESLGNEVNSEYLRIFIVNQQGMKFPMKTNSNLSQYFPKNLPISTTVRFEYEVLDISLKEFENMKTIKISWLNTILNSQYFEILVSINDTVTGLVKKLLEKVGFEGDTSNLFMWCGNNCKYVDLVKFNKSVETLNESLDYYIGNFPTEVNILVNYDMFTRYSTPPPGYELSLTNPTEIYEQQLAKKYEKNLNLIPVFHFYKNSNYHHSVPFLLLIFPGEKFSDLLKRLQFKLGLNDLNFSKIKFALADNSDKGKYLDDRNLENLIFYDEIGKAENNTLSLALDHPDRNPRRNPFDRGIQIK